MVRVPNEVGQKLLGFLRVFPLDGESTNVVVEIESKENVMEPVERVSVALESRVVSGSNRESLMIFVPWR